MRQCPNCNERTISVKWLLFNKSNSETKYCFECSNCNLKIRKQKNLVLDIITAAITILGFLAFISAIIIEKYLPSFIYALASSIIFFTVLYFVSEYSSKLKVAEENYCVNGLSKKGAIFALIIMGVIICMTIYCLIIQPFILNVPSCS